MKKMYLLFLLLGLLGCVCVGISAAESDYNEGKALRFQDFIRSLKTENMIPSTDGEFYFFEDYEHSLNGASSYEWNEIGNFENFVISTEIYGITSMKESGCRNCGCGIVFRDNGESNFMVSSLRLDGQAAWWGIENGKKLKEISGAYGSAGTKGRHDFSLVVTGTDAYMYVDGEQISHYEQMQGPQNGNLGFAVLSDSQKDYGVHCEFWDTLIYTW